MEERVHSKRRKVHFNEREVSLAMFLYKNIKEVSVFMDFLLDTHQNNFSCILIDNNDEDFSEDILNSKRTTDLLIPLEEIDMYFILAQKTNKKESESLLKNKFKSSIDKFDADINTLGISMTITDTYKYTSKEILYMLIEEYILYDREDTIFKMQGIFTREI